MLLLVYRSFSTLLLPLAGVLIEMLVTKGVIATLGHLGYIELSSFAVNIVVSLTLGAGTDYGIFLWGDTTRHGPRARVVRRPITRRTAVWRRSLSDPV